jgi:hypothetical protein
VVTRGKMEIMKQGNETSSSREMISKRPNCRKYDTKVCLLDLQILMLMEKRG